MKIRTLFSGGYSKEYHIAAFVFAVIALGMAVTTTILAQDTTTGTNSVVTGILTTPTAPITCSYNYGDWNTCQSDGKRYRTVTSTSPTGCVKTNEPLLSESCNYSAPQCGYSYSSWGTCQSDGKQDRSLLSKSPSGCAEYNHPVLEQNCTYTSPVTAITTTANTTTSTTADQCVYAYSDWEACQSNGKRTRSLASKSPSGCVEYTHPALEQSCVYDNATTTAATDTATTPTTIQADASDESSGDVTPLFSFMNMNDGMTIKGTFEIKGDVRGAQGVEYYLVPVGSNTYKYIGSGSQVSETGWNLSFRSKEFPNGEFYLRAKIKNIYGEYGSGQHKIHIANEGQAATTTTVSGDGFVSLEMNDAEEMESLQTMAEELQIPKDETADAAAKNPDQQRKYIFEYCQSDPQKCFPERDSDNDGLSDVDELRYGTNPKSADSDLDGFIDGDEVKNGFDPLKYSAGDQSDRIVFEDPKVAGETKGKIYAVQNVEMRKTETGEKGTGGQKLYLTGKGLPNSFVTIYVYSDPIILTVKTDNEGNWTYELDKELEDGDHEAYVAITDNTGKITAKSEPIFFVKTAQAVTVIPSVEAAPSSETLPVTRDRAQRDILLLVSIVIAALAVALATIGLIKHRHGMTKEKVFRS